MTAKSRDFEMLVARIEGALLPQGAKVTSPDRIRDIETGVLREVDASIRITVGSSPVLITIECRDRQDTQDATWIEQLISKMRSVGAAKTIAVSAAGFTGPAKQKAKTNGIELRTLKDLIDDVGVRQLLAGIEISAGVLEYRAPMAIDFELEDGGNLVADDASDELLEALSKKTPTSPILTVLADGRSLCTADFASGVDDAKLPGDETWVAAEVVATFGRGVVGVSTRMGTKPVACVRFRAEFRRRTVLVPIVGAHEYSNPDGPIKMSLRAELQLTDGLRLQALVDVARPPSPQGD